jgi:hypothetical protein
MSAKTLERTLGISYRTAWMILQRFRVAMVNKERKQLSTGVLHEAVVLFSKGFLNRPVITKPITENDVKYGYDWDY